MRGIIQIEPILMQSFVFFILISMFMSAVSFAQDSSGKAEKSFQAQTPWQAEQINQHILVSSSTQDGIYQINAKMYVHATPDEFFALLEDTAINCQWIANCNAVEILNKTIANIRYVHTVFDSPWPVADREMYTRSIHEFSADHQHLSIIIDDIADSYPAHPRRVMIRDVRAQWSMTHYHNDWYELSYLASADPGGVIPQWLSKQLLKDSTAITFTRLRERLHADKIF